MVQVCLGVTIRGLVVDVDRSFEMGGKEYRSSIWLGPVGYPETFCYELVRKLSPSYIAGRRTPLVKGRSR